MSQNNSNQTRRLVPVATAIVILGLLVYAIAKRGAPAKRDTLAPITNGSAKNKAARPSVIFADYQSPSNNAPEPALNIRPDAVLVTVNGRALTANDVLPPGASNQPVSPEVCEYFLQKAIDRELIFQTAQSQGLALDESQKQQMENFKTMRGQSGPGLVQNLNGGSQETSFEMRDAEAFMLQTSLMEKSGASPNVTAQQVLDYYRQNARAFGQLPADEPARREAWENIDLQIRNKLASNVRSDFQNQLIDYMKQLKARADIQLTPLASFAGAN